MVVLKKVRSPRKVTNGVLLMREEFRTEVAGSGTAVMIISPKRECFR